MYTCTMENKSNAELMQGQLRYPFLCSFCVLVMATLLTLGGLQSAPVVEAVDITFYNNSGACTGEGHTVSNLPARTCAVVTSSEGPVPISGLASDMTTIVHRNGGCTTEVFSRTGPNVWCVTGGGFTALSWWLQWPPL